MCFPNTSILVSWGILAITGKVFLVNFELSNYCTVDYSDVSMKIQNVHSAASHLYIFYNYKWFFHQFSTSTTLPRFEIMFSSRKSAVLRCASSSVLHTLSCCSMSKNISFTWHWLWFVQKTQMLKKNTTSKTWHSTTSWPPTSITSPFIVNLKYPAHFGKR